MRHASRGRQVTRPVVLFADRLWPHVGGMEMHAHAFIEHFTRHPRFPLRAVVSKDDLGRDVWRGEEPEPAVVFFNSGRWIEDLLALRARWPRATFVYRTGGNEILKAPLERLRLDDHAARQAWWAQTLGNTIDLLITNSGFTEDRLRSVGVSCRLARCVGGVDMRALVRAQRVPGPPRLCSVARFVPYKNHSRLVDVVAVLVARGHDLRLRLVGDGPLRGAVQDLIDAAHLAANVELIGALENEAACAEIAAADLYVQLSSDCLTSVPGGQYVHAEGMGRSILEALSAGTFVIAGDAGALPEIVTGDRGLLVDTAASPTVLADLIAPLLSTVPRPKPTDVYAWEHVFARYERLWEEFDAPAHRH